MRESNEINGLKTENMVLESLANNVNIAESSEIQILLVTAIESTESVKQIKRTDLLNFLYGTQLLSSYFEVSSHKIFDETAAKPPKVVELIG